MIDIQIENDEKCQTSYLEIRLRLQVLKIFVAMETIMKTKIAEITEKITETLLKPLPRPNQQPRSLKLEQAPNGSDRQNPWSCRSLESW